MPVTYPRTYPLGWGEYAPLDHVRAIEGTSLAWTESHCENAKALLLPQFRDKPRLEGVLCKLAGGVQDLSNAAWQVLTETLLDSALGLQLDELGGIIGLPRQGWPNETYRTLLRAWVLVLSSAGTNADHIAILDRLGIELVAIDRTGMAEFRVVLGEPLADPITPALVFRFLVAAKSGGVRLTFEYPTVELDEAFAWADGDVDQVDAARGWADDGATLGGYWSGDLGSTETI
jgi:hypothetical protein